MATVIQFKRSSTQNDTPSVSDLALGEVAINTYHGRMYTEKNDGSAACLLYTSPSPRDVEESRMPSSA